MARPTIVFIPGAFHSVAVFDTIKSLLEAQSYPCAGADPPSVTSKEPLNVKLEDDVAFYRETVILPLLEDGKDMVLLQHSYGGASGGGAVQDLSKKERKESGQQGGVLGLIWVTALCLPVGESVQENLGLGDDLTPWTEVNKEKGTFTVPDPVAQFYNHLPLPEAQKHALTVRPQALGTFTQKASYAAFSDAMYGGRCAYILCEDDQSIILPLQQLYVQSSGITLTETVPASHSPFLDMPERMVEIVLSFVKAFEAL